MCGIAGMIGGVSPQEAERLALAMAGAQSHRGPDDYGVASWSFQDNSVAFGHRRLSIIDLSPTGRQPMTENTGRYWITFNGEIYNYLELRRILDPSGTVYRSTGDTEVILHAFARWRERGFAALRGMFALAILDIQERAVWLARDPMGIKPLYYAFVGDKLLFASEARALLATGETSSTSNPDSIAHYLARGWGGTPASSGIQSLPAGCVLRVDLDKPGLPRTLDSFETGIPLEPYGLPPDQNESTGHMRHLLAESVKGHMLSDVPVGLFLSGGIDSTALLHLMREASNGSIRTFTVVFPEKEFSEREYARRSAERYGTDHTELELTESDLLAQIPEALNAMDQPTMDGVNSYVISKAVRSAGVKVALSGLGADELFAGYPSFKRSRLAHLAAHVPGPIRRGAAAAGRLFGGGGPAEKLWDLLASDCSPLAAYSVSRRLFSSAEQCRLMPQGHYVPKDPKPTGTDDYVNEVSRLELRGYMTDLLLRDTDFMSMACSLEVRVPFVDKVVVRAALEIPGDWKLQSSRPKPLLLDAMQGAIPEYVWDRKKQGFLLPFARWMRSQLRKDVESTLTDPGLAKRAGLVPEEVAAVWRSFLGNRVRWSKPWSLFVLLRWMEERGVSA